MSISMNIIRSEKAKLKWKEPKKYKDEYRWGICQIQEDSGNLHFKFSGAGKFFKNQYMTIENYKQYTALDIINALKDIGFNTRHSYEAVMQFYKERDLEFGFIKKILKPIR